MKSNSQSAFSLVEIMVAMAILSMTVISVITLQNSSLKSSMYAKELTIASMLARSVMVDAYLEQHTRILAKAIKEEKNGDVEMAGLPMKWTWVLSEVPLEIPELSSESEEGEDKAEDVGQTNPMLQPIIKTLNTYLKEAMRELSVQVSWQSGGREEKIFFVTHLIDFSHPLQLPNLSMPMPIPGGG